MDYFAEERTRQAEEVVKYLPDTIFSAANFPNILTKQEIKEFRQSFKKQKIYKDMVAHKAFKKFMKPGMSALRKAFKHVREKGFEICEGEGGCNSCCRRLVLITSKLEVDTITRAIRLMDFDSKDRLQKAMERRERKYRGIAIACGVTGDEVDEDAWFHMGELYPEVGGMCPALGDTGRCLIYPVRPWTCRTYRVLGGTCAPMTRINLARFSDIDSTMLNLMEKHAGETKTTLFPVIRNALKSLSSG